MEEDTKTNGAFVGLVIIILILVIGGIYVWQMKIKEIARIKAQNEAQMAEQANIISALEQDIENIDTDIGVDANTVN